MVLEPEGIIPNWDDFLPVSKSNCYSEQADSCLMLATVYTMYNCLAGCSELVIRISFPSTECIPVPGIVLQWYSQAALLSYYMHHFYLSRTVSGFI